ncbi:MAG: CBS domain-containing protein [Sandaracinaceae bacterium]|nr:CBS domain-containing protein [Sandaracinaceae bacterium]
MARLIRDVMTAKPKTLAGSATLAEAARVMRQEDIGDVLVVDDGKPCGIVTDRDIVVRGIAAGKDPGQTAVKDIASKDVVTLGPDDSIDEAIRLMREHAVRRIPVMESGKPVGIVSLGDLAVERDQRSVLGQVSAAPPNK